MVLLFWIDAPYFYTLLFQIFLERAFELCSLIKNRILKKSDLDFAFLAF